MPTVNCNWLLQRQLTAVRFAAFYCDLTRFGRKIKINRNLFRILRNFTDTSIKIHIDDVKSFVTFRISLNFFYFFDWNAQNRNWKNKKKSPLIRNVTKLCTSSICIFIEVSVKFRRILNKFRFILIFRPKRIKSQLELHLSAAKSEAVNCL